MRMNQETTLYIEAGKTERQYFRDLWQYRELFYFLSLRDILVRYKQTVIGILWAVLRPFLTMVVFTFVFGSVANLPSEGSVPYPILVYTAMLPWQFFASALQESSNSLITNANLVSKVYFPKLIVPISSIIVSFIDFFISFIILIGLMVYYHFIPSINTLYLPIFIIISFLAALGLGLWLSALNVKYRDFRYIVPFIVQFGLYISPVGFSSTVIPLSWKLLYSLNPMVGVIDGFRWSILGKTQIYYPGLIMSVVLISFILITGVAYFRNVEKTLADII